jgi:hypothetical protein
VLGGLRALHQLCLPGDLVLVIPGVIKPDRGPPPQAKTVDLHTKWGSICFNFRERRIFCVKRDATLGIRTRCTRKGGKRYRGAQS